MIDQRPPRLPAQPPTISAPRPFVERRVSYRRAEDQIAHREKVLLARALDILASDVTAEARLSGLLRLLARTVGARHAAVIAAHNIQTTGWPLLLPLLNPRRRHARALNDYIRAAPPSQVLDYLQALGLGSRRCIYGVIGSQPLGKIQTIIGQIHGHDRACAQHSRLHQETHSERPNTEHHHGVIKAERFAGKRRHLLGAIQSHRYRENFREHGDFRW